LSLLTETICLWATSSSFAEPMASWEPKEKCKVTSSHILPDKWQRQRRCITRWYLWMRSRFLTLNKTPAIVSCPQTQQSPVSQEEVCRETGCSSRFTSTLTLWNSLFDVLGNFMIFWGCGRFATFLIQCFRTDSLVLYNAFMFLYFRSSVSIRNFELSQERIGSHSYNNNKNCQIKTFLWNSIAQSFTACNGSYFL